MHSSSPPPATHTHTSQHTVILVALAEHVSYRCGCAAESPACWQSRSPPARPVCGWWRSAPTAGWSPPGWPTEWPHRCAGPTACCHPSSSGFLPEEKRGVHTGCHADKLTISCAGKVSPSKSLLFPPYVRSRSPRLCVRKPR